MRAILRIGENCAREKMTWDGMLPFIKKHGSRVGYDRMKRDANVGAYFTVSSVYLDPQADF